MVTVDSAGSYRVNKPNIFSLELSAGKNYYYGSSEGSIKGVRLRMTCIGCNLANPPINTVLDWRGLVALRAYP